MPVGLGQARKIVGHVVKGFKKGSKKPSISTSLDLHRVAAWKAREKGMSIPDWDAEISEQYLFLLDDGDVVTREIAEGLSNYYDPGPGYVKASVRRAYAKARDLAKESGKWEKVLGAAGLGAAATLAKPKEAQAGLKGKVVGAVIRAYPKLGSRIKPQYFTGPNHSIAWHKAKQAGLDPEGPYGANRLFITNKGKIVSKQKATKLMEQGDQEMFDPQFGAASEDLYKWKPDGAPNIHGMKSDLATARGKANELKVYGKVLGFGTAAALMKPKEVEAGVKGKLVKGLLKGKPLYRIKSGKTAAEAREKLFRGVEEVGSRPAETALEPRGLYFALRAKDLDPLVMGPGATHGYNLTPKGMVQAQMQLHSPWKVKLLKAHVTGNPRILDTSEPGVWEEVIKDFKRIEGSHTSAETNKRFTNLLKKEYDIVLMPDVAAGQENLIQAVVLNKGFLKGKLGKTIKTLGIAGATAGATLTLEEKAEGVMLSSASRELAGKVFRGKTIKKILKGRGKWREIIFGDGSTEMVDTNFINYLARHKGTESKMTEFAPKGHSGKVEQAMRSLVHRLDRVPALSTKTLTKAYHKDYVKQLTRKGEIPVGHTLIKHGGRILTMPKPYARTLEDIGVVKILEDPIKGLKGK